MKRLLSYFLIGSLLLSGVYAQNPFQILQQRQQELQRQQEQQRRIQDEQRREQMRQETQRQMERQRQEMQRARELQMQQQRAEQERMRQQQQEAMRQQQRIQQEQQRQQQQVRQQQLTTERQRQMQQARSSATLPQGQQQRQNIAAEILNSRRTANVATRQNGPQADARRQEILKSKTAQEALDKARAIRLRTQDSDRRARVESSRAVQARNATVQQQRTQSQIRSSNVRNEVRRVEAKAQADRLRLVSTRRDELNRITTAQTQAKRLAQSKAVAALVANKDRANAQSKRLTPIFNRSTQTKLDYSADFEKDLKDFNTGAVHRKERLEKDLVLVQYHADRALGNGRSAKWWTSLDEANKIATESDLRQRLALPWDQRSKVTIIRIPKGTEVEYYVGTAKQQETKDGTVFAGGGTQFRLKEFDTGWIVQTKALPK